MRLYDAVADIRSHIEARRAGIAVAVAVGVVNEERDVLRVGNRRQIQPRRLKVDRPGTACKKRRRERYDLGGYRARSVQPEKGSVTRAPNVVLDIWGDTVVKRYGGATERNAGEKESEATTCGHPDMDSSLQEIVILAVTATSITIAFDVEAHVEHVSVGKSIVNYLDIR
jgi:hypothetical protein